MGDLTKRSAFAGLALPLEAAGVHLTEVDLPPLWSVSPYPGQDVPLDLRVGMCGDGTIWAGVDLWFVTDPPSLEGRAAVTEQGDGWVALDLAGPGWEEVFARLCPVDPGQIDKGVCVRSQVGHMVALIIGLGRGVRIMAMRSFAHSLHHELAEATTAHAARQRM